MKKLWLKERIWVFLWMEIGEKIEILDKEKNRDNEPLVSILIPCYNHYKYLNDCMQSILEQKYSNVEVLVCDDCSIDNSWELLTRFEKKFKNKNIKCITIKNEENKGITKTLNSLLALAQGVYVKIIASDDFFLDKEAIGYFVNYMQEHKEVGILICNGNTVEEESRYPVSYLKESSCIYKEVPNFTRSGLFERIYVNNFLFAPGAFIRRDVYTDCGKYDEKLATEDWEFWLRVVLSKKWEIAYIDKQLIGYRKSQNSMTSVKMNAAFKKRREVLYKNDKEIIDTYGKYVTPKLYAKKKMTLFIQELRKLKRMKSSDNYKQVLQDIKEFDMWKYLSLSDILRLIKNII